LHHLIFIAHYIGHYGVVVYRNQNFSSSLTRQREKKEKLAARNQNGIPLLDEERSLSLIFRGAKTLDLLVDVGGDREMILYVLNSLVAEYGRAKVKVGNEVLLLRYIWNDIDRVSEPCFFFILSSTLTPTGG
jgi:hypothetical protein